jgi:hypothetical protein
MKTDQLIGKALDWAVAQAEGKVQGYEWQWVNDERDLVPYKPSTSWEFGGPIIERERITVAYVDGMWIAATQFPDYDEATGTYYPAGSAGPTPLIAAMRSFANNKLGAEIEIPEELMK